jgi:CysZ protein
LLQPIQDTKQGVQAFGRGWRWLRARPRYLALLFVPALLGLLSMAGALSWFAAYDDQIVGRLLFAKPERWYLLTLYYGLWALAYGAAVLVTLIVSMLVANIAAAPFYEIVSVAVEREVTGRAPPELGLWGNVRVAWVEVKKAAFIIVVSIILLFIPGLNVISVLLSAFLIGWNFFDYPLARRGWSFRERLAFVRREFWSVLGFGLWLVIPFAQIVMMPLAVAGGTMLGLEALRRRDRL